MTQRLSSRRHDIGSPSVLRFTKGAEPPVPTWAREWAQGTAATRPDDDQASWFTIVSSRFDRARDRDIAAYQPRVFHAYEEVLRAVSGLGAHPVRLWAYVAGIHDDLGAGLDRYMAFNAARSEAFACHFAKALEMPRSFPTASAVGIEEDSFVLHCLASARPGVAVENPRQVAAYRYSRRYGPVAPCFARATQVQGAGNEPVLLVGGTASIVGQESQHDGNLLAQAAETLRNLAYLVGTVSGDRDVEGSNIQSLLSVFRELRVYCRGSHFDLVVELIRKNFASCTRLELVEAVLCRHELMIEIEGVARPRWENAGQRASTVGVRS